MNKARVAEAARGIIQKKNVRKDLKVDSILHKWIGVCPNLKWSRSDVHRIEDPDKLSGIGISERR